MRTLASAKTRYADAIAEIEIAICEESRDNDVARIDLQCFREGLDCIAILVLLAVLMMRYNVVIGGQEISKTGKGLLHYSPLILHHEGIG